MKLTPYFGFEMGRKYMRFVLLSLLATAMFACEPTLTQKTTFPAVPAAALSSTATVRTRPTATKTASNATVVNPTATPTVFYYGPQLKTPKVRQESPPDALKQIGWFFGGGGPGCGDVCCDYGPPKNGIEGRGYGDFGITNYANGEIIDITSLDGDSLSSLPGVCVSTKPLANSTTAIAPNGAKLQPYISVYGDGSGGVWLPIEAFSQPGIWHLVVEAPDQYFDFGIGIPQTKVPNCSLDDNFNQMWLWGFDSNEHIVGIAFDGEGFVGAFNLQVDSRGHAIVTNPFSDPYINVIAFTGENQHTCFYPRSVMEYGFREISGAELSVMLYNIYWGGSSGETIQTASRACPEALPPQLSLYNTARVTINNGLRLRVRGSPSKTAKIIYNLAEGETVYVVWGPVCADGWMWWKIYTRDANKNEIVGWAAEGDSQAGYFLEPFP